MSEVTISTKGFDRLAEALGNVASGLSREIGIVVWATAKHIKSQVAKGIVEELATTQKVIRKTITQVRKDPMTAVVSLKKTARIPLRAFRARQTKAGVSAKISRTKGGHSIPGAFIIQRWNGNAYIRTDKSRGSLKRLFGPSPWGVFVKKHQIIATLAAGSERLEQEIDKRIRYLHLKEAGQLNWQQEDQDDATT